MRKILTFLFTVHCSLFTFHALEAQVAEPTVTTSVFFGISEPIRDMPIVLPGIHKDEQKIFRNRFPKWSGEARTGGKSRPAHFAENTWIH